MQTGSWNSNVSQVISVVFNLSFETSLNTKYLWYSTVQQENICFYLNQSCMSRNKWTCSLVRFFQNERSFVLQLMLYVYMYVTWLSTLYFEDIPNHDAWTLSLVIIFFLNMWDHSLQSLYYMSTCISRDYQHYTRGHSKSRCRLDLIGSPSNKVSTIDRGIRYA